MRRPLAHKVRMFNPDSRLRWAAMLGKPTRPLRAGDDAADRPVKKTAHVSHACAHRDGVTTQENALNADQSGLQIGVSTPPVEGACRVREELAKEEDTRRSDGLVDGVELRRDAFDEVDILADPISVADNNGCIEPSHLRSRDVIAQRLRQRPTLAD